MKESLDRMLGLPDLHFQAGQQLFAACGGNLFPCDALAFAVVERSLGNLKGFQQLMRNGCYTTAFGLLRLQLDNTLRLFGVTNSEDPHETASKVIAGTPLRKLKDTAGQPMTDKRLVELYGNDRPWVARVYAMSSAYIHLSEQHVWHFVARSPMTATGQRSFAIGDGDEHVLPSHKQELADAFEMVTFDVLAGIRHWADKRCLAGSLDQLRAKYGTRS